MWDLEADGGLWEDTLSLRVARSGTKRPATVVMPWQAEVCQPCLGAKDRRLPKVFLQLTARSAPISTFFMSFASKVLKLVVVILLIS